jgi:hypothetical protein
MLGGFGGWCGRGSGGLGSRYRCCCRCCCCFCFETREGRRKGWWFGGGLGKIGLRSGSAREGWRLGYRVYWFDLGLRER